MIRAMSRRILAILSFTTLLSVGMAGGSEIREQQLTFLAENTIALDISHFEPIQLGSGFEPDASAAQSSRQADALRLDLHGTGSGATALDASQRVPEPRNLALAGCGTILLGFFLRRKPAARKQAQFSATRTAIPFVNAD